MEEPICNWLSIAEKEGMCLYSCHNRSLNFVEEHRKEERTSCPRMSARFPMDTFYVCVIQLSIKLKDHLVKSTNARSGWAEMWHIERIWKESIKVCPRNIYESLTGLLGWLSTNHLYAKFKINGRSRSVWMPPHLVARTLNFGPVYSTSVSEREGRCV